MLWHGCCRPVACGVLNAVCDVMWCHVVWMVLCWDSSNRGTAYVRDLVGEGQPGA
jgi:hypothetical protein